MSFSQDSLTACVIYIQKILNEVFLYVIYKTLLAVIKALKSYSMLHKNSLSIIRNLYKILTVPKQNN